MNKVILVGRLTGNPDARQTQSGTEVCTFTLAVNRRFNREQTDFIPVVTWRGLAENCAKYLSKGQRVAVSGELQSRGYEDKNGNKRTAYEVSADDVEFLERANRSEPAANTEQAEESMPDGEFGAELLTDEKLPF